MSFGEEWKQLPAQTKMMIVGGGGLAVFFLFTAVKNRNSAAQQQQASTGPQTPAIDPTSWMDAQNQQMQAMQQMIGGITDSMQQYQQANQDANQQNTQAMQQLIQQNQQATQQQLQALMGNMGKTPTYSPAPAPAAPPPSPVPAVSAPAQAQFKMMGNQRYATPSRGWDSNSVVDYVKQHGGYADFASMKILAQQSGISNYSGTAAQNTAFLQKLKSVYG